MLNPTEFYYLNSTTITFSFRSSKIYNPTVLFQTLKKNRKIIEVVFTDHTITLFLKEKTPHNDIVAVINQAINLNKKNKKKIKNLPYSNLF